MQLRKFAVLPLVIVAVAPFVALAMSNALAASGDPDAKGSATCGVERWPVKTLSDKRVKLVKFRPHKTSIAKLRSRVAPDVGTSTPRIKGAETRTFRVRAQLIEFKSEDDRDVHLVIGWPADPSKTMIVEFPDTTCPGARKSPKKGKMAKARRALETACGIPPSSSFAHLTGTATVTGVGFFDILHGQTGVAPNGIELHPVLRFVTSSCKRS